MTTKALLGRSFASKLLTFATLYWGVRVTLGAITALNRANAWNPPMVAAAIAIGWGPFFILYFVRRAEDARIAK